ncbi:hypothetical protein WAI453_008802 [Rhynchosporium graminicola]
MGAFCGLVKSCARYMERAVSKFGKVADILSVVWWEQVPEKCCICPGEEGDYMIGRGYQTGRALKNPMGYGAAYCSW